MKHYLFFAPLILVLLSGVSGAAPLSSAFNYQGFLAQNGVAAQGQFDLRFEVYDAPGGGGQIGSTVFLNDIDVTNGLFSVQLDFGPEIFLGDARWLATAVRPGADTGNFSPLPPRDNLTAAPYSLFSLEAGNASNLNGQDASAFASATHLHDAGEIVTGILPGGRLAGHYDNQVDLTNEENTFVGTFIGDGSFLQFLSAGSITDGILEVERLAPEVTLDGEVMGLVVANDGVGSQLDADLFDGLDSSAFWRLGGNVGGPGSFLGTLANHPLIFRANNIRVLRLEPSPGSPNLIGGFFGNEVSVGFEGGVIGGGGRALSSNRIAEDYATIGGGIGNRVAGYASTVGGGHANLVHTNASYGTIPGGSENEVAGNFGVAMGRRAKVLHEGAFVFGDAADQDVTSTAPDQFTVRAANGVRLTVDAGPEKPVAVGERYRDNGLIAWAKVGPDGSLLEDFGVAGVVRLAEGQYEVTINAVTAIAGTLVPLVNPVVLEAPDSPVTGRVASVRQINSSQFHVYINRGDWERADNEFVFMVTGR